MRAVPGDALLVSCVAARSRALAGCRGVDRAVEANCADSDRRTGAATHVCRSSEERRRDAMVSSNVESALAGGRRDRGGSPDVSGMSCSRLARHSEVQHVLDSTPPCPRLRWPPAAPAEPQVITHFLGPGLTSANPPFSRPDTAPHSLQHGLPPAGSHPAAGPARARGPGLDPPGAPRPGDAGRRGRRDAEHDAVQRADDRHRALAVGADVDRRRVDRRRQPRRDGQDQWHGALSRAPGLQGHQEPHAAPAGAGD